MPLAVADLYDPIYHWKEYDREAAELRALIRAHNPSARTLLDVGCGTGQHLARLRHHYAVQGSDLDPAMLRHARARLDDDVPLHPADMVDLDLGRRFDVVTCLFSAIGYTRTLSRLHQALRSLAKHLAPGGLLIVEPWHHPDTWKNDVGVHVNVADQPGLKIARLGRSELRGRLTVIDHRFLVATPAGFQSLRERLVLGLFTDEEYRRAFEHAGLRVERRDEGLTGRGIYLGFA